MGIDTIVLLLIAVFVAVLVISALAKKHVFVVTSLSPERAAEVLDRKFSGLAWKRVEGRGTLNYRARLGSIGGRTPPVMSIDIDTDEDTGLTQVEFWMSEWTSQWGMVNHIEKVFWKRWSISKALRDAEQATAPIGSPTTAHSKPTELIDQHHGLIDQHHGDTQPPINPPISSPSTIPPIAALSTPPPIAALSTPPPADSETSLPPVGGYASVPTTKTPTRPQATPLIHKMTPRHWAILAAVMIAPIGVFITINAFTGQREESDALGTWSSSATVLSPTTNADPLPGLSGADSQGFIGHTTRCGPGKTLMTAIETAYSMAVVCETSQGTYEYKGERLSDRANLQLDDAVPTGGGWDVTNPADGARYEIRPDRLRIFSGSQVDNDEPSVQYASR